jgi:hypothetical protein
MSDNLKPLTLKELILAVSTLNSVNTLLPNPLLKSEVVRKKDYHADGANNHVNLSPGQIAVEVEQVNKTEISSMPKFHWLCKNGVVIVPDEIKSIQWKGESIVISLE